MANGQINGSIGFEQQLWQIADKLRNNVDVAEYKHVVLGLIFLKYISDAFEEKHNEINANQSADELMGDAILKQISTELASTSRSNFSIDWTIRENVQAKMRVIIKRL